MAENIVEVLQEAVNQEASDVFLVAGTNVSFRTHGSIVVREGDSLKPDDTREMIRHIYEMAGDRSMETLEEKGDDDFSFAIKGVSRFRVNTFKQRGSLAAVIRIIAFEMPSPQKLHIPESVMRLGELNKGLVLVTGPAGSGKSTTLACIIDYINQNRAKNIITLEDPIEYLHKHSKSIVSQREIDIDTESYVAALRAALRQSPDVILLGEMRDYETMAVAMTAAETGLLLFSTLHTIGASNTINRIIDVFPANQQHQIAVQLSMVLTAVVFQQLLPTIEGTMVPAHEIMTVTPAIRNLIRDNRIYQIDAAIDASKATMVTMDQSIMNLYRQGIITRATALEYASNRELLEKRLDQLGS